MEVISVSLIYIGVLGVPNLPSCTEPSKESPWRVKIFFSSRVCFFVMEKNTMDTGYNTYSIGF